MRKRWRPGWVVFAMAGFLLVLSACRGDEVAVTSTTAAPVTTTTSLVDAVYTPQSGPGTPVVVDYNPTSSDVTALLFLLEHSGVRVDAGGGE